MVFGLNKKQHKVPDLSRYDYYYKGKQDLDEDARLSSAAAFAASASGRSTSMINTPRPVQSTKNNPSTGYRTYSVRSQSNVRPVTAPGYSKRSSNIDRFNSFSGAYKNAKKTHSIRSNSRTNSLASSPGSIVVKTTEVKDLVGRTQSITTKTVKRVNGYEYVETTTKTTSLDDNNEYHFNEFTSDFIHAEEEVPGESTIVPTEQSRSSHPYRTYKEQLTTIPDNPGRIEEADDDDDDDDEANFSDALDYVPRQQKLPKGSASVRRSLKKSAREAPKRTQLTEQEMYAKALEIAQRKVYGPADARTSTVNKDDHTSTMSHRLSVRNNHPVPGTAPPPKYNNTKRSSVVRSMSNRLSLNKARPTPPFDPPSESIKNDANVKPHRMTDEEIHAKALEIARKKYTPQDDSRVNVVAPVQAAIQEEPANNNVLEHIAPEKQREAGLSAGSPESVPLGGVNHSPAAKSKVKSFFGKVVQFSQDNYGYQPKKNNKQEPEYKPSEVHKSAQDVDRQPEYPSNKVRNDSLATPHESPVSDTPIAATIPMSAPAVVEQVAVEQVVAGHEVAGHEVVEQAVAGQAVAGHEVAEQEVAVFEDVPLPVGFQEAQENTSMSSFQRTSNISLQHSTSDSLKSGKKVGNSSRLSFKNTLRNESVLVKPPSQQVTENNPTPSHQLSENDPSPSQLQHKVDEVAPKVRTHKKKSNFIAKLFKRS